MKRILKITGIVIVLLLLFALSAFLYINSGDIPTYEVQPIDFKLNSSQAAIARGEKLTLMLCANCHLNRKTRKLTGMEMADAPPEFGQIYTPNITQDKTYGIGDWTDGDLVRLLRTGVKKNGQYSPPYMAKLPLMADEDINAIVAFFRSAHPMVQADPTPDKASEPSFLTKFLCRVEWEPFPMPAAKIELPDSTNSLALGQYLAHNLDCYSCHSADFKTNDFLNPASSTGYFAGGNKPLDRKGRVMLTSNLTPDKETGIGSWTKADFIRATKYGIKAGEPALAYPMMPYASLTDTEAGAIFDYLQTIPPINNKIERSVYD